MIKYFSTNFNAEKLSFSKALLKGLAPDKGLYMPESIPVLEKEVLDSFRRMEYHEIAYEVARLFTCDEIPSDELKRLTKDAYNFSVPLERVYDRKYILRLDQGPTASFKDFAARLMGRLMNYFLGKEGRTITILTATSGDTGSAVANAFYGLENIKVVVLFPVNEISDRQRKQMTTLGKNVKTISLNGKFDDCQAMVKMAFTDADNEVLKLSSANSINIGRLIPQSMFYFYSWSRLAENLNDKVVFSVPSGNFGNLMGGIIAREMGLPVEKFIVSTNENDEVPVYFRTNKYRIISPSHACISSAMNVGHPSNMSRIITLYGGEMNEKGKILKEPNLAKMQKEMWTTSVSDEKTKEVIKEVWQKYKVLLEPHGAVSWEGLRKYLNEFGDNPEKLFISLETAHPAKFPEHINEILKFDPDLPPSLDGLEEIQESAVYMENDYAEFKNFLHANYSR
jgi:threonine synthase